jgi:phosphopantothenoylcysteine decarboxylase/phosphopantothenate--cysteine ligase
MLKNKKILIAITGSIAAYKIIILVRQLIKEDAEVKCILTPNATQFVSPIVLSTLCKNEALVELHNQTTWSNHVMLGRWADVMLIAPASCNTLAKMANGLCDNLVMAVYLSATCPVCIVPAMDEDMWNHPTTQKNISTLQNIGNTIIDVATGELGSGLYGKGRMQEPEQIVQFLKETYCRTNDLKNKNVLITVGATQEAIDPVRFISNHSSGKMGMAIAESFFYKGATVTMVKGFTQVPCTNKNIQIIDAISANTMYEACKHIYAKMDIIVCCAAVADYTPATIANKKIKKADADWSIALTKTADILHYIGTHKQPHQFVAGFALETNNAIENAQLKRERKNADCIFLNEFNANNQVFGNDNNQITIVTKSEIIPIASLPKKEIAETIVQFVIDKISVS